MLHHNPYSFHFKKEAQKAISELDVKLAKKLQAVFRAKLVEVAKSLVDSICDPSERISTETSNELTETEQAILDCFEGPKYKLDAFYSVREKQNYKLTKRQFEEILAKLLNHNHLTEDFSIRTNNCPRFQKAK